MCNLNLLPASHLGTANGTGTILASNNQASFSFNISNNNKKGTPSGTLTYTDVKGGIKLTSTAITAITLPTRPPSLATGRSLTANQRANQSRSLLRLWRPIMAIPERQRTHSPSKSARLTTRQVT